MEPEAVRATEGARSGRLRFGASRHGELLSPYVLRHRRVPLRATLYIAQRTRDGRAVRAEDVAAALSVPRSYLSKILHVLARNGGLESARGPAGGFRLAEDPDTVAIYEVIRAFESLEPRSCILGRAECSDSILPGAPSVGADRGRRQQLSPWDYSGGPAAGGGESDLRSGARRGGDSASERSRPEPARQEQPAPARRGGGSAPERSRPEAARQEQPAPARFQPPGSSGRLVYLSGFRILSISIRTSRRCSRVMAFPVRPMAAATARSSSTSSPRSTARASPPARTA